MDGEALPAGWCVAKLSDVATHHSGNSKLIKGTLSPKRQADMHPAFSATGQDVWCVGFEQEGSAIIISAVGARCGKCFKADGKWSAIANTHVVWPIEDVADRDFLWFKLNDENFWVRGGSAQPFVKTKESFKHEFGLPPLAEQQRIVEKIETLFAELDKGEEALRKVQKLLARYRQSVLKAAVTGELTADWRDANGRPNETGEELLARILKQRRESWQGRGKYKDPIEPDTDDLPELPTGWAWASFEQLFEVGSDGGKKLPQKQYALQGRFPVIDQGEKFVGGFSDDESLTYEGDLPVVLFGDHTRRFKLVEERFICGADGVKIICPPKQLPPSYSLSLLRSASFEDRGYSRHFQFVRKLVFPVAPPEEAAEIFDRIQEAEANAAKIEELLKAELNRSTALRRSILKDAFSGKLVPQDPSDEPAEKLLERIRAVRSEKMKPTRRKMTA